MITIDLVFGGETSSCYVGEGLLGEVGELVHPFEEAKQVFVVTDATVGPLYAMDIAEQLDAPLLELPVGEEHKRWQSVERVARWLITNQAERQGLLVAVGGGVMTDVVGFAAAIVLRGMPWVAIPTTLLGMVDAAIGGKTGIDLDVGKNLIGAFWPPRAVITDPLVLATLDLRQMRSGLAEVVKCAMIAPSTLEHVLDSHLTSVAGGDPMQALELVVGCVRVKAEIVSLDERESGPRRTLNLGHTLAHGLEGATDFSRFLHGEAVAWGLLAELRLARDRGLLSTAEAVTWAERLQALAPLPSLEGIPWAAVAPFVGRDKKRKAGRVGWVLPRMGGVVLDVEVGDEEAESVYGLLQQLPHEGTFATLF